MCCYLCRVLLYDCSNVVLMSVRLLHSQVVQRQQLQKEKDLAIQQQQQHQSILFSSKLPLAGRMDSAPPPLAPLSGGTSDIQAIVMSTDTATDSDGTDTGKNSPVVTSNKMLADLLDRKSGGPPFVSGDNKLKRKMDVLGNDISSPTAPANKRSANDDGANVSGTKVPSSNAANLYAKLAASLLEDEDMDEEIIAENEHAKLSQSNSTQKTQLIAIQPQQHQPMQRHQIIVSAQQQLSKPLIIQQQSGVSNLPMPMILHQAAVGGQIANYQITQQGGQSVLQPILQTPTTQPQNTTQYMLATNSQGQTYLLAQQATPTASSSTSNQQQQQLIQPTQQQALVMHGSVNNKTIYILQQSGQPQQQQQQHQSVVKNTVPGQPQAVILTSSSASLPQPVQLVPWQPNQQQQPPAIDDSSMTDKAQILAGQTQPKLPCNKLSKPPQLVVAQKQTPLASQSIKTTKISLNQQTSVMPVVTNQLPKPQTMAVHPPQSQPQSAKPGLVPPMPKKTASPPVPTVAVAKAKAEDEWDTNWLYVCDWRGCPR